jgi:tetratricopeptide (TPR) repeat protein
MTEYPEILGVYSLRQASEIGAGATATKREQLTYWYVRRTAPDKYDVQPLNAAHVPSGLRKEISEVELLTGYTPEPTFYRTFTVPALDSLARKVAKGEAMLAKGDTDEAERQFLKALMLDDANVQANYGLGEVYSEKKDFDKLKRVMHTLLGQDEAFGQEHRERFNSFGISLRKNKHYDDSVLYYTRALELNAGDENVHFNMARVLFEKGELEQCLQHLNIALAVNPDFAEARKFLAFVEKKMGKAAKPAPAQAPKTEPKTEEAKPEAKDKPEAEHGDAKE